MDLFKSGQPLQHTNPVFRALELCTITVGGVLTNTEPLCERNSVPCMEGALTEHLPKVESSHYKICLPGYVTPKKPRTTNRGRREKPKQPKRRRQQGEADEFQSSILFYVVSDCVIEAGRTPPAKGHYHKNEKNLDGTTTIRKEYKLRVFRNGGKFNMAGILSGDLSDAQEPIRRVCEFLHTTLYLNDEDSKIEVKYLEAVMRNYRTQFISGKLDLAGLVDFMTNQSEGYVRFNSRQFLELIKTPIFRNYQIGSQPYGWYQWARTGDDPVIDPEPAIAFLQSRPGTKDAYLPRQNLVNLLKLPVITELLKKMAILARIEKSEMISNSTFCGIMTGMLHDKKKAILNEIIGCTRKTTYFSYDPEKGSCARMKIKCPYPGNPNAEVKVRLFKSSKININGCKTKEQAMMIYEGLTRLFQQYPQYHITGKEESSAVGEWSESESEGESESDED